MHLSVLFLILALSIATSTTRATTANSTSTISLQFAGSSLASQLYERIFFAFGAELPQYALHYSSVGSTKGKCRLLKNCSPIDNNVVDVAATDSIFASTAYVQFPDVQLFPAAVSAVVAVYNLPFLKNDPKGLILTPEVTADVFRKCSPLKQCPGGYVSRWDDQKIIDANPHIDAALLTAAGEIKVVVRSDGSGTSEIWKTGLAKFSPTFATQFATDLSDSNAWTNTSHIRRSGNRGVCAYVLSTPNSISYTSLDEAVHSGARYAGIGKSLLNEDGVLRANQDSVQSALVELGLAFGNNGDAARHLTATISGSKGSESFAFVGYTYFAVLTNNSLSSSTWRQRQAVMHFFEWYYTSPKALAVARNMNFGVLPDRARAYVLDKIRNTFNFNSTSVAISEINAAISFPVELENSIRDVLVSVNSVIDFSEPLFYVLNAYAKGKSASAKINVTYGAFVSPATAAPIVLTDNDQAPTLPNNWLVQRFAVSGWGVVYNLCSNTACDQPGDVPDLILTVDVIAGIFSGQIKWWNDTSIQILQGAVTMPNSIIGVILTTNTSREYRIFQTLVAASSSSHSFTFANDSTNIVQIGLNQNESFALVLETKYSMTYGLALRGQDDNVGGVLRLSRMQKNDGLILKANITTVSNCRNDALSSACWPLSTFYSFKIKSAFEEAECFDQTARESVLFFDFFLKSLLTTREGALEGLSIVGIDISLAREKIQSITCFGRSIVNPQTDNQLLPVGLKWAVIVIATILFVCFMCLSVWLYWNRRETIVRTSSPLFGQQMILGYCFCVAAVYPMTIEDDDRGFSQAQLNFACMSWVWLFLLGFFLVYSALLVKTLRVYLLFHNQRMRRLKIRPELMFRWELAMSIPFFAILIAWQINDPLVWSRTTSSVDEATGFVVKTTGQCGCKNVLNYLIAVLVLILSLSVSGVVLAWKNRNYPTEFSEGRYVSAAIWCDFQLLVILIPLLALVSGNVLANFVVKIVAIQLSVVATSIIFFGPKIAVVYGLWTETSSVEINKVDWFPVKAHVSTDPNKNRSTTPVDARKSVEFSRPGSFVYRNNSSSNSFYKPSSKNDVNQMTPVVSVADVSDDIDDDNSSWKGQSAMMFFGERVEGGKGNVVQEQ